MRARRPRRRRRPTSGSYGLTTFPDNIGGGPTGACTADFPCTWDPDDVTTSAVNKNQNVSQVFYFVNNFHDWLARAPFGFTAANGNFEGSDPVSANALDGANPPVGPDGNHIDNANMSTPARRHVADDADVPVPLPGHAWAPDEDPFLPSNGGDDGRHRLPRVHARPLEPARRRLAGNSTLDSQQAGSMGEAWSDWYAMDYLVERTGLRASRQRDAPASCWSASTSRRRDDLIRSQAIDCPVGGRVARPARAPAAPARRLHLRRPRQDRRRARGARRRRDLGPDAVGSPHGARLAS